MPNDKNAHNDTSTPDASARPTMHRPLRWLWLAVAVIALDLVTKYVASAQLNYAQPVEVLPFFNLTLLHNPGAAFSFLATHPGWQRWFFAIVAIGASVGLTIWLTRIKNDEKLLAIALPLIIGGALGNLYDRLVHGYVVDFLSFHVAGWYYPAFNVADIAITLGAVALIWESIMGERRRKKAAKASHKSNVENHCTLRAAMSDYLIDDGMEVTLHFTLKLEDGTLVDSTKDKAPATFEFGDGNLPPGFEHPIKGLAAGQEGTFQITPEHAFGQHNPQNIQTLKRADFGDEAPEIGMVMSFADKAGTELPGVVKTIDGDRIEVDFNHPLAGRTLTFEVEVLDVKPVTTH